MLFGVHHTALRRLSSAIVILSLIVLTACAGGRSGSQGTDSKPEQVKQLRIGYLNVMDDAQAMLAYDAKLYDKHGLNVELRLFESGTDLIKAMVGGQLDAGVLGFTNAVTWASKGAGLKVVGGAQMGFHSILVRNDSGIEKVEDLKGKKLASQKQGSTADIVLTGVTLKNANLTKNDLNMVYAEPAQAIQSLASGAVDAAFVFEPYDRIAQLTLPVKQIYEIGKVWPFPCMVVITTDELLNKDRDAVNRMLDAQKEAIEMLQNDPERAAQFITKRFIEGESFKTADGEVKATDVIRDSIKSQTFTWEITPDQIKRMQEIIDIMVEQKALEKPIKVEDILDLEWQNGQKNKA
mgnify:CR=1 FL=1